jgi:ABC-type multidrug transport system ATPase subunit
MSVFEPTVKLSGLVKSFDEVHALAGVNLSVPSGIFGLIGPNGAGKTTLLRIMLGLIKADSGQAEVLGLDCREKSLDIRRRVGVLHEKPSFFPAMTVIEYLERIRRVYRSSQEPWDLLALVGLDYARERKIGKLSAGMHQRLGLAQALIGDPELVFLDEPTSNLDVDGRDEIIRLIVNLNSERGVSFFISSHILSEVERACHHIAFIKEGKIVESGPVRDIIQRRTQWTFRVICSDPEQLHKALSSLSSISSSVVSGANSITIASKDNEAAAIQEIVGEVSGRLNIKVYEIEKASTLEDAYREAMRDG